MIFIQNLFAFNQPLLVHYVETSSKLHLSSKKSPIIPCLFNMPNWIFLKLLCPIFTHLLQIKFPKTLSKFIWCNHFLKSQKLMLVLVSKTFINDFSQRIVLSTSPVTKTMSSPAHIKSKRKIFLPSELILLRHY